MCVFESGGGGHATVLNYNRTRRRRVSKCECECVYVRVSSEQTRARGALPQLHPPFDRGRRVFGGPPRRGDDGLMCRVQLARATLKIILRLQNRVMCNWKIRAAYVPCLLREESEMGTARKKKSVVPIHTYTYYECITCMLARVCGRCVIYGCVYIVL